MSQNDSRTLVRQVADGLRQGIGGGFYRSGDVVPSFEYLKTGVYPPNSVVGPVWGEGETMLSNLCRNDQSAHGMLSASLKKQNFFDLKQKQRMRLTA